ncbi:molybdopterin molybdotransferase MoeA [Pontiellaceae bacterium B1224]|nr:molybdopterin molybdotransferase MoeA [Pontiellaceae bacterium B1224]
MITFEEAIETVLANTPTPQTEAVPLNQANGRILMQDVLSDHDMPPFNKSAMDGYACRRADLPGPLHCLETIAAGDTPKNVINTGRCAKIMTGAIVPEGADCVFMVEQSQILEDNSVRFTGDNTRDNICFKGEDVRTGDIVLHPGSLIRPGHIAVLAAAGCVEPIVAKVAKVGILSTGSELVPPSALVSGATIRETSGQQLVAQVSECGCLPIFYGIVEDDEAKIATAINQAVEENDVVLICGGSSAGDFDFVPLLLEQAGFQHAFEKVAIQPGKPLAFAVREDKVCFGMPGNPVSTFMTMETIVKPFLYRSMGHDFRPPVVQLKLGKTMTRKKGGRMSFVPGHLVNTSTVEKMNYNGSAHIHAMAQADGWIIFPMDVTELEAGSLVDFWQL